MSIRPPFKIPGSDSYYVEINRQRRSLRTSDPQEAETLYKAIKQKYLAGQLGQITNPTPQTTLFKFSSEYLSWAVRVQPDKTFKCNRLAVDKLCARAGDIPLPQITVRQIDDMVAHALSRKLKKSSVNNHIRHIKSVFNKAVDWGYLDKNPFSGYKQLRIVQAPPKAIPVKQLVVFFEGISDPYLKNLVTAYFVTGRSRAELLNLKWSEVDLERSRYFITRTKTHLSRWYPINTAFKNVMEGMAASYPGYAAPVNKQLPEYVFHRRWHPDTVTHRVKAALVKAKLGNYSLHSLRHSFARMYLEAGGTLRALQDLLGHTQYSTTEVYSSLDVGHLDKEAERVRLPGRTRCQAGAPHPTTKNKSKEQKGK